jgi:O-antigen biosynthesis protein
MMHDVTVILPQYGQPDMTTACLQSLRRHEPVLPEMVVVDDGSPVTERGLPLGTEAHERRVQVRHRGLTAAWNIGVRLASTEFILLVNNDVRWTGPVLQSLLQPLRDETARVVGAEWRWEPLWPKASNIAGPPQPLISGWGWGFRRRLWDRLGGFDEALQLYFSDTDFQLRVLQDRAAPGFQQMPVPWEHAGHQSTRRLPDRRRQWERDRERFLQKWS